jgi:Kef-type K+ transport system membrane component KefB
MTKMKQSFSYFTITGGLIALMYWIVVLGTKLDQQTATSAVDATTTASDSSQWANFINGLAHNLHHPLAVLLAQIATIIFVARVFGWVCTKIKQPVVIGEMIAGIMLGPSFVGMHFPEFSANLFPKESLGNLQFVSQIGLILFMYIVGMEISLKTLKDKAYDAVIISHASIFIPFTLGMGLSYFLYEEFAPDNIPFSVFALFSGVAMSITAFPVLARIVQERGINKTKLGTIALTCAAADDVSAWCILAALIAFVKAGTFINGLFTIVMAIAYVIFMIRGVRPFLQRISEQHSTVESVTRPVIAIFFLVLILSAYVAEIIGIHALFGAFMAGAIMPDNENFRKIFIDKVQDVALVLLLPLFFVFTGLRTQIGLLNDPYLWQITALIIFVAVLGKFAGSALAAKFVGQNWKDSLSIGALMNTRGLMELVVLNIGYDLGVLSAEIFAMMVIMAVVTTCMTGPALDLINKVFKNKTRENAAPGKSKYS